MLSLNSAAALSFNAPVAPVVRSRVSAPSMLEIEFGQVPWSGSSEISTKAGMEELAKKLNPTVGFYDPLGIVGDDVMPETIGWFRHAEIKHGRVAMAAFVGYCVPANGIHFPWNIQGPFPSGLDTVSFGDISAAGGPADQWDALPTASKLQILGFVALFEFFGENSFCLEASGEKHYMRGGKPGFYPDLKKCQIPHPVPLTLWDPFGFTTKLSAEKKANSLIAEINNGRLAMLGIMGFVAASKVEGSVPALTGVIKPYAGEVMAPFAAGDVSLPYVADMLKVSLF